MRVWGDELDASIVGCHVAHTISSTKNNQRQLTSVALRVGIYVMYKDGDELGASSLKPAFACV